MGECNLIRLSADSNLISLLLLNKKHNLTLRKQEFKILPSEILPRTRALHLHHMKTHHEVQFKKPGYQQDLIYMFYCFIMYLYYVP